MKKLKRQSVKATVIKDTLGLGSKPASTHVRSKSASQAAFISASATRKQKERPRTQLASMMEDLEFEPVSHAKRFVQGHQRAMSFDDNQRLQRADDILDAKSPLLLSTQAGVLHAESHSDTTVFSLQEEYQPWPAEEVCTQHSFTTEKVV